MSEWTNVKGGTNGAKGNGTDDDFVAVQTAVSNADGKAVYFLSR